MMEYLFTKNNLNQLKVFCKNEPLLAFDFDGTLAPIISDPEIACMRHKTEVLLFKLCASKTVAIITGRSLRDINRILKIKPKYLVGNHGAEGSGVSAQFDSVKETFKELAAFVELRLEERIDLKIALENKELSLSLHYRNSPNQEEAKAFLSEITQDLGGDIRLIPGKSVVNLVAQNSPNKYSALLNLIKSDGAASGLFIGDDDTDEDVFKQIDPNVFTVRVGHRPSSQAMYYLEDQSEMDRFLELLLSYRGVS